MTTAWELIEDEYKSWLINYPVAEKEFNELAFNDRRGLRDQFLQYKQQQQQQQQQQHVWHNVYGTIERNRATAGVRFKMMQLASLNGYYPSGTTVDTAFATSTHPSDPAKRLLSLSVVFRDLSSAEQFQRAVDGYVNSNSGVRCYASPHLERRTVDPIDDPALVYESEYRPNEPEGESPNDSPVCNLKFSSVDMSSAPSSYKKNDTVFKFQRIEIDAAFGRCNAQGAHIFPKAKCIGVYEWLDKQKFNRLALSNDAREQFDGTGRGNGVNLDTIPQVCLEPIRFMDGVHFVNGEDVDRLLVHLWLRQAKQEQTWRPFLPNNISIHVEDNYRYFQPLYIDCEINRRVSVHMEELANPDGTFQLTWTTAIPGVADPTTLGSFDARDHTVAVKEVIFYLLQSTYNDTRRLWRVTP